MQSGTSSERSGLAKRFGEVEREVADFFSSLRDDEFVHRVNDAWTPAEHLHHLNIGVSAVAKALGYPKLLPRVLFGRARGPSRTFEAVRDTYRGLLAGGGGATGAYVPPRDDPAAAQVPAHREALLARWGRVNARLVAAAESWTDAHLDRIRLPHPILGKLTVREMLFFTLYHNTHHVAAAKRRLDRFRSET
ncbi:DinB family protein [Longimicrobium terrae]|uniref:DinB-like domain-containing protein n=1 Tax=Longimicrobium terrae TaxID=1639882 RepID=A0A841GRG8_9BACT|nr:DinB family protein [Longimicrobium terrae]MBB4635337.1 hypothetical protein [Longimicrobium terrae]MBB6069730.1 hypothetical protein [Longimicrobium terrae]NNC31059.1 DinB family protein [Longimicrobium terrae]